MGLNIYYVYVGTFLEYDGRANRGSLLTSDSIPNWHQPSPSYKQLVNIKFILWSTL